MPPKKRVSAATQIYREVDGEAPAHTPVKRQKLDRRSALTEKQGNRTNSSGSSRNLRSTDDSAASSTPKKPLKSRNVRAVVKKEDLENVNLDVELAGRSLG